MTLMPVSSMTDLGSRSLKRGVGGGVGGGGGGAGAVDGPAGGSVDWVLGRVQRLPEQVVDVAEDALADRHADRRSRVLDGRTTPQAAGRLQRDGPDLRVADVLGDLACDPRRPALALDVDLQGGVDLGELGG